MSSPHHRPLRLGTRGSPLARAQAGRIAGQLSERCGRSVVLVTIATPGDRSTAPIERLGTTGVFTTTLRETLLRGDVDLVVHSCKDLPTAPVPGLQVAAYPAREDPRDALVWPGGTSLDALPDGARIGTGKLNRLLRTAFAANPPPMISGRRLKLFYATQTSGPKNDRPLEPPEFVLFVNDPDLVHFSYRRYLENQIRRRFGFEGTGIRIVLRGRAE